MTGIATTEAKDAIARRIAGDLQLKLKAQFKLAVA